MPNETQEKQEILDELTDMFYEIQPDEEYVEENEDTAESIQDIHSLIDDASAPIEKKIKELAAFNNEWFPDGLSADEQVVYRTLLLKADALSS